MCWKKDWAAEEEEDAEAAAVARRRRWRVAEMVEEGEEEGGEEGGEEEEKWAQFPIQLRLQEATARSFAATEKEVNSSSGTTCGLDNMVKFFTAKVSFI